MWDGTVEDMNTVLSNIATKYNKKVMVAETAYPYTFVDADGSVNNINDASAMRYSNYDVSLAGQTQSLYEVIKGVSDINNIKVDMV